MMGGAGLLENTDLEAESTPHILENSDTNQADCAALETDGNILRV
jgi:hypothetical protein